jgi:hypothetical protein
LNKKHTIGGQKGAAHFMVKTTMFINNVQTFKTTPQKKVTANKRQHQLSGKIHSVSNLVVQSWRTLDIGLTL